MVEWYRTCKEIPVSTLLYPLPKKCSKYTLVVGYYMHVQQILNSTCES